jgi:hypothetical protein
MSEQRITWFRGDRPVNGNTVWVKPAEDTVPEPGDSEDTPEETEQ